MNYHKPMLIAIEGADGAGTTTQAKLLDQAVKPWRTVRTAEPTAGPIGSLTRQIIGKRVESQGDVGRLLALLFAADRQDHLNNIIEPALYDGCTVITDRYFPSSFVYQADEGIDWLQRVNELALVPDITFFLDIDHKIAAQRIIGRGEPVDMFDEKVEQMCQRYREMMKSLGALNVIEIDGALPKIEITRIMRDHVRLYQEQMVELIDMRDVEIKGSPRGAGGQQVGAPPHIRMRFKGIDVTCDSESSILKNKLRALSMIDARLRTRKLLGEIYVGEQQA